MASSDTRSMAARRAALPAVRTEALLIGAIVFCLLLQLHLVFTKAINWDEFRFLADVHRHVRGELAEPLQTFHVHLFAWLPRLPFDEIGQIVAARIVMLAVEGGTIALVYGCARRFVPTPAALVAALAYASFGFVVTQGASFRFDPPSIALLMLAAFALLDPVLRLRSMVVAGVAVAVAGLITIKSALFLPTLAVIAVVRVVQSKRRVVAVGRLAVAGAVGAIAFGSLYLLHLSTLATADPGAARWLVEHSGAKTLGHGTLFPNAGTLVLAVTGNVVTWLLVLAGLRVAVGLRQDRSRAVVLLAFALPLVVLLFYRNSFPYFYAWLMAPVAVLAGVGATAALAARRLKLIALLLAATAVVHHLQAASPVLAAQRATIAAVHAIFPAPIAYIDRSSMVASHRKVGPFMSSWGLDNYHAAGRPIMRELLLSSAPPLLIANAPALEAALAGRDAAGDPRQLRPDDAATLRASFIPHWGPLWVAGKRLTSGPTPRRFELLVAGTYTIESVSPTELDGVSRAPGDAVRLTAGYHSIASADPQPVQLRWGVHLRRPAGPPPAAPLFAGF